MDGEESPSSLLIGNKESTLKKAMRKNRRKKRLITAGSVLPVLAALIIISSVGLQKNLAKREIVAGSKVSPEAAKPSEGQSLLGTHLRLKYPSLEVMILLASQPSTIKTIRSPDFQKLLEEANLPADVLDMMQNVYFPKGTPDAPTPQDVKGAFWDRKYKEILRYPEFTAFIGSPQIMQKFLPHFGPTTKAGDFIAMASKPEVIETIRKTNFFERMEYFGLSHQLAEILTGIFFPEDGKVPSSEDITEALSSPLAKAVLQSSEFQTVLRSEGVADPISALFKPVESVSEFIEMYSNPTVVKVVQSDAFKELLREAGMKEKLLQTFLAIYNPKDEEIGKGKTLSDYVKEKLSTDAFRLILAFPEFRSAVFSAKVADAVMQAKE